MKHFTILEVDGAEIKMVGTIQNIAETKVGKECFWDEIQELLESHFDSDVTIKDKTIDLFNNSTERYIVEVDVYDADIQFNSKYKITIMETWFNKNF